MRLAVEARYVKFMLGDDNVAVILKRPIMITVGCGVRHQITWRSSFLVRGGVKLFPVDSTIVEVGNKAYKARAWRRLKYATVVLAEEVADITLANVVRDEKGDIKVLPKPIKQYGKFIKLEKPELATDGHLVFEVNGVEAKLTSEDPTHVLFVLEHKEHSRVYDSDIKVYPQELLAFKETTSCKTESVTLAVAIAPVNSSFITCYNVVPYRHGEFDPYYKCYMVKVTVPPKQEFLAGTPNPDQLSLQPNEVI
jgi:hypothetical protein